jgi:hypothetical protein
MILIEKENITLDYYSYKLPVYNYLGNLLYPYIGNQDNLDFNINYIDLIGLIIPKEIRCSAEIEINNCYDDLNENSKCLLMIHLIMNEYFYNIPPNLIIKKIDYYYESYLSLEEMQSIEHMEEMKSIEHTEDEFFKLYYNIYNTEGNQNMIINLPIIHTYYNYIELNNILDKFSVKYKKYKNKYLKLKYLQK